LKAVRKIAQGASGVVLQDVPEPRPGPGQIKVRVHTAGICGTDLHIMLMDDAALCEPLACVVRAVTETACVTAGDRVLVSGPGTIGFLVLQVAAASGAGVVVAGTSADQARLNLASQLGAVATLAVDTDNLSQRAGQLTGGMGFHLAFECAGVAASAQTCFTLLRKTGHYGQMGLFGRPVQVDFDMVLKKDIRISTNFASERSSWERALRLLTDGKVSLSPLISARLPLVRWAEGFDMALGRQGLGLRVLLTPGA
jgi:L-iditol 2-dehydrogenase